MRYLRIWVSEHALNTPVHTAGAMSMGVRVNAGVLAARITGGDASVPWLEWNTTQIPTHLPRNLIASPSGRDACRVSG